VGTKESNQNLLFQAVRQLSTRLTDFEATLELLYNHLNDQQLAALDAELIQDNIRTLTTRLDRIEARMDTWEVARCKPR
jgi:hypothetical protein